MPVQAAAALEVQRIIREDKLIENVSKQGVNLERRLKSLLSDYSNVGDIQGQGLFCGLEFVKDIVGKWYDLVGNRVSRQGESNRSEPEKAYMLSVQ